MKSAPFKSCRAPGSSLARRCRPVAPCAAFKTEDIFTSQPHFGSDAIRVLKNQVLSSEGTQSLEGLKAQSSAVFDKLKGSVPEKLDIEMLPAVTNSVKEFMRSSDRTNDLEGLRAQGSAVFQQLKRIPDNIDPQMLPAMTKSVKSFIGSSYSFPKGSSESMSALQSSASHIMEGLAGSEKLASHWGSQAASQVADVLTDSAATSLHYALSELVSRIPSA